MHHSQFCQAGGVARARADSKAGPKPQQAALTGYRSGWSAYRAAAGRRISAKSLVRQAAYGWTARPCPSVPARWLRLRRGDRFPSDCFRPHNIGTLEWWYTRMVNFHLIEGTNPADRGARPDADHRADCGPLGGGLVLDMSEHP